MNQSDPVLWTPDRSRVESAEVSRFMRWLVQRGVECEDYNTLYDWSIMDKQAFWSYYWDFAGIIGHKGSVILENGEDIEHAVWFPEARLNFAENLLQYHADDTAIYFKAEDKLAYSLSYTELHQQVASIAAWLKKQGVRQGDRVAAYMANIPETVVAMLAATSLGAIWTSTSPDFWGSICNRAVWPDRT